MIEIDRYRPADRDPIDTLYRRVFGDQSADSYRERWEWLHERNPNLAGGPPLIWIARDGATIVGKFGAMPVRLAVNGQEVDAAWGMGVMVAPEGQRQGLGRILVETWDRNVGAAIGLGLTDASHGLFKKMQWPDLGRVSRLAKPLTRSVLKSWSEPAGWRASAALAWRRVVARYRPLGGEVRPVEQFDDSFTALWQRVGPAFAFAVRRDAAYLNWRFVAAPHLRYTIGALRRNGTTAGYAVIRHVQEPRFRVTILVDFLADPADPTALSTLLGWVDRQAMAADSELIRVFATHGSFLETLRGAGYSVRAAAMRLVAKINAVQVPPDFYESLAQWHVTSGDSDVDR